MDEPIANSSRLVLPTSTAPAARSRCTTVASYGGRHPSRMRDEHVVGSPRVVRLSLIAIGTPASGPGSSPRATAASTSLAARRASSARTRLNAWISDSRASTRARCSSSTSRARAAPGADIGRDLGARSRCFAQDARHPEAAVLDRGRGREHFVAVEAGAHLVGRATRSRAGAGARWARRPRCRARRPRPRSRGSRRAPR